MKPILKIDEKRKKIIVILLVSLIWNCIVYSGSRLITYSWHHTDVTSRYDEMIPFASWTVILYIAWYAFWAINYWICAGYEDQERDRFFCADILAKTVCLIIFMVFPTTNVRPEIANPDFFDNLMRLIYFIDTPDNLFPSLHCIVAWLCWIGVRNRKKVPTAYKIFSFVFAIAICISTLTTKQHVIIDMVSGIALAEICYFVAGFSKIRNVYSKGISKIFKLIG